MDIKALLNTFRTQFAGFTVFTAVDILIVAYFIYLVIKLCRDTRAVTLLKGIIVLVVLLQVSGVMGLETTNYVLKNTMQLGVIAVIIVFQPELRRALEQFGRKEFFIGEKNSDAQHNIAEIADACNEMSKRHIGALIVLERTTKLGETVETGHEINAALSSAMLRTLFFPNSPMHDGAVIVRGDVIRAAGCFLPLSKTSEISKELGTRHRAAIGISEVSDSVVVVVSEETGTISVAENGKIRRGYSKDELIIELSSKFAEKKNIGNFFFGNRGKEKKK